MRRIVMPVLVVVGAAAGLVVGNYAGPRIFASQQQNDTPAIAAAQTPSAGPTYIKIEGYRSAKFGMTQAQVKNAIKADFGVAANTIKTSRNAKQGTEALSVDFGNENAKPPQYRGIASYIFGHTSHKLFQVNLLWSTRLDPKLTIPDMFRLGQRLRQQILREGLVSKTIRTFGKLPDGGRVLLAGADAKGRAIMLQERLLREALPRNDSSAAGNASANQTVQQDTTKNQGTQVKKQKVFGLLVLSLMQNPAHPDVQRQ